jgi:hypothetical protein
LEPGKRAQTARADTAAGVEKALDMFLHVTGVRHTENYKLEVTFNDGAIKEVDLEDELYGEVFEPLQDVGFFKQATVNEETNTIEWPNGADFSPEFLYEVGKEVKRAV